MFIYGVIDDLYIPENHGFFKIQIIISLYILLDKVQ